MTEQMAEVTKDTQALSFMREGTWQPIRSGDWETDCNLGRAYAVELVDHMNRHDATPAFMATLRSIFAQGAIGGVEVGFVHQVAALATYPTVRLARAA